MSKTIPFFDLFSDYIPERTLRLLLVETLIEEAAIDQKMLTMDIKLISREKLPAGALEQIQREMEHLYRLRSVHISARVVAPEPKKKSAPTQEPPRRKWGGAPAASGDESVLMGGPITAEIVSMASLSLKMPTFAVSGRVFAEETYETRRPGVWCMTFDMTDNEGSVRVVKYMKEKEIETVRDKIKVDMYLTVQGRMKLTRDGMDLQMEPYSVCLADHAERMDNAPQKRVELHLHTNMSNMDALTDPKKAVQTAIRWGHPAIAITDHGVVQSFPAASSAAGGKIKILYGVEAYFVNNLDDRLAVHGKQDCSFEDEIVCFDIETTGLNVKYEAITEIGAVVLKNGEITEKFQTFVNPNRRLTPEIIGLTGITDEMLSDAPQPKEALQSFLDFVKGRPLAAHNAEFDIGFIRAGCEREGLPFDPTYIDSLILAQNLLQDLTHFKLDVVAERLKLPAFNHHRASDDGATVGYMLVPFSKCCMSGA